MNKVYWKYKEGEHHASAEQRNASLIIGDYRLLLCTGDISVCIAEVSRYCHNSNNTKTIGNEN